MRIITFVASAAAILALSSTAALAGNDTTNIQVGNTRNIGALAVGVDLKAGGAGDASSLAVGNLININSPYNTGNAALDATAFSSFQSSVGSNIGSGVGLLEVEVGGDLTAASQAINNHGSFSSDHGKLTVKAWQDTTVDASGAVPVGSTPLAVAMAYNEATAIQLGDNSNVLSAFVGADLTSGGSFDGSSLSVGNNLSFKADDNTSAVAFQSGNFNNVVSLAGVADLTAAGNASLTSTAINNNASWQTRNGGADGINFQYGSNANVISAAGMIGANIGGNLNIGSVAAGNIAQIGNY